MRSCTRMRRCRAPGYAQRAYTRCAAAQSCTRSHACPIRSSTLARRFSSQGFWLAQSSTARSKASSSAPSSSAARQAGKARSPATSARGWNARDDASNGTASYWNTPRSANTNSDQSWYRLPKNIRRKRSQRSPTITRHTGSSAAGVQAA
ncbi:hypothetical protein G6F64_014490 [Rhizopus arrhizus]|uniref:Uncharacterized protein n=1 Tax=Rhizopus oryzae TaxID=64495 RepID=A0A9P6WTJ2_RHIOR|nr:hypothetical protein G6F64_014490 [Rhizopus arrhizus]